jgi:hypothetical protein
VYPGNVLILDMAIAPCQDAPFARVASPCAASTRPGMFPRFTSSRSPQSSFRPLHSSSRPEWRDLSFSETQIPDCNSGRSASPWAPVLPTDQPRNGRRASIQVTLAPTHRPRRTCPAARAGRGTRLYGLGDTPGTGCMETRAATGGCPYRVVAPARCGRGGSLWLPVLPEDQIVFGTPSDHHRVLALGFSPGSSRRALPMTGGRS